ncbi:MAG: hypothetical protein HYZ27_07570, partial [Deltaproteobacteria bacterium]|nr:hypothetical protein [Deltaproteobacteria bacterium]
MRTLLAVGVGTIHLPAAWADAQIDVLVQLRVSDTETVAAEDAVVWLPGFYRDGAGRHTKRIVQRFKRFDPRVTVISTGKVVEFPNFDRIDHNVFSLSDAKTFDLGLYRSGASRSLLFDRPGVVGIH